MDEQEQDCRQSEQLLERIQEIRQSIQQKRGWSRSPLDWLLLWQMRRTERFLQAGFAASEQAEAEGKEEDYRSESFSFSILHLAPSIPVQISLRLPFSRDRIQIGKDSLARLRRQVRQKPDEAQAHITLAAHLLSEQPLLPARASEAVQQLREALRLMPPEEETADKIQGKAMVHKFLGDALIVLGERTQARAQWEQAILLDPVPPPHGFSGPAQEMLNKYPLL